MNTAQVLDFSIDNSEDLPFGPLPSQTKSPLLCVNIAKSVRAFTGEIWLIQKIQAGLVFRCSINRQQIRLLLPTLGHEAASVCPETNSKLHIVTSIEGLHAFLGTIKVTD